MRTTSLIKTFAFEEENRSRIELGAGARLNPEFGHERLELAEPFTTDPDIWAKTWVTDPTTVQQWTGFEVFATHVLDDANVQVTSLGFRLSDGTDQYWWDGGAWVVNTTAWNTEAEVAGNIASFFPATVQVRKLQVVVNLKTTNAAFTPKVHAIKVLYESTIEFQEDLIYRSLVPLLRDGVRGISRLMIQLAAATDTIDIGAGDYKIETPYNIVGIDAVFNRTDDPDMVVDILQSYDANTKTITLTASQGAGSVLFIRFEYEPEVAVTTSQDYTEVEKVPSIILDDINLIEASALGTDDSVINRATSDGKKVPAPLQGKLEVLLHLITDKGTDHQRLADELKRFFANNPTIKSVGMDERFRLFLIDEFDMTTPANSGDLHTGRIRFRIENALFFVRDSVQVYGVKRLVVGGDMNITVEA